MSAADYLAGFEQAITRDRSQGLGNPSPQSISEAQAWALAAIAAAMKESNDR